MGHRVDGRIDPRLLLTGPSCETVITGHACCAESQVAVHFFSALIPDILRIRRDRGREEENDACAERNSSGGIEAKSE